MEVNEKNLQRQYKKKLSFFSFWTPREHAYAESFNAKIKAFGTQFRGLRNIDFFLFRLSKLFAESPTFVLGRKS